jgi:drug/metabolite transporter (DMT)-like permease
LGALALLPFILWKGKRERNPPRWTSKQLILPGLLTGLSLFGAASLQQIGLVGTSAGKAGFITGLYVILVPLLGLVLGKNTHPAHWIGAALDVPGMYLLFVQADFTISSYDLIVLAGAFLWAVHVHLITRYAEQVGPLRLAVIQAGVCGVLSGIAALLFETINTDGILDGLWPILYGAILSVGIAYTLQVVAQRKADPTHAVIILSLESVFAGLGGWIFLNEAFSIRDLIGSGLMLSGMFVSQLFGNVKGKGP